MNNLLEKISWLTRRWNFKFSLFNLYFHDEFSSWGFELFKVSKKFNQYSALAISVRLPNKTNVKRFTIDSWDVLFLKRFMWNWWESLDDKKLWGGKLTPFERISLKILNRLIK